MIRKIIYNRLPQSRNTCNICFSKNIEKREYLFGGENKTIFKVRKPTLPFIVCCNCGYSFCIENHNDYFKISKLGVTEQVKSNGGASRVGDGTDPGREYLMAIGAIKILGRLKLKILIYAPGMSKDHELLRKHPHVSECKITDLKNFQESTYFIPLQTKEIFDIIIVCEVVEHFTEPRKEFLNFFSKIDNNSLIVISTNLRWVDDFSKNLYPFLTGHTSYYSPKALMTLAEMNKLYIDFRTPVSASTNEHFNGKNYIYVSRGKHVYYNILNYFSKKIHPLSE